MKILLSEKDIEKRISELASTISKDYQNKQLLLISILKGSFIFLADLCRNLSKFNTNIEIDFIKVKSYSGQKSTGKLTLLDKLPNVAGKDVLIVEDIFDTGLTLYEIYNLLLQQKPASLNVATFIVKKVDRNFSVPIKYYGFEVENLFVVGYGLDFNEKYRCLPYVAYIE